VNFGTVAIVPAVASAEPAVAQQIRAGLLTCDVSAGLGLIITSQKQLSCEFVPDRPASQQPLAGIHEVGTRSLPQRLLNGRDL
jgi:hypothetical protein